MENRCKLREKVINNNPNSPLLLAVKGISFLLGSVWWPVVATCRCAPCGRGETFSRNIDLGWEHVLTAERKSRKNEEDTTTLIAHTV